MNDYLADPELYDETFRQIVSQSVEGVSRNSVVNLVVNTIADPDTLSTLEQTSHGSDTAVKQSFHLRREGSLSRAISVTCTIQLVGGERAYDSMVHRLEQMWNSGGYDALVKAVSLEYGSEVLATASTVGLSIVDVTPLLDPALRQGQSMDLDGEINSSSDRAVTFGDAKFWKFITLLLVGGILVVAVLTFATGKVLRPAPLVSSAYDLGGEATGAVAQPTCSTIPKNRLALMQQQQQQSLTSSRSMTLLRPAHSSGAADPSSATDYLLQQDQLYTGESGVSSGGGTSLGRPLSAPSMTTYYYHGGLTFSTGNQPAQKTVHGMMSRLNIHTVEGRGCDNGECDRDAAGLSSPSSSPVTSVDNQSVSPVPLEVVDSSPV